MYSDNNQVVEAMKTGTNISEHEYTRKGTMFRRVLTDGNASSGVKGSTGSLSSDSDSSDDDSTSSNPFENALSKLGTITSSYIGTILGGKEWDESMLQTKSSDSSDSSDESVAGTSVTGTATGDAGKINGILRGVLAGKGDLYVKLGQKYGVDPALMAAITISETGGNSKALVNDNNPAGVMDWNNNWKTIKHFDSLEEGIEFSFKNLKTNYIDQGLTTVEQIGHKYAPVGAANDPNGLNANWIPTVTSLYNQAKGGSGFESMPAPLDLNAMYEMNNNYENGGAGEESIEMNQNNSTEDFIYNNYKSANDRMNDTMTATNYQKNSNDNLQLDEIIALLKKIDKNTFDTVNAVQQVSGKVDNIKTQINNTNTKIENNNTVKTETSGNKDVIDKFTSTKSSNKISEAYFKASGIARGRRR